MVFLRSCIKSLGVLLFFMLVCVVLLQVSARYAAHFPLLSWVPLFAWTEELSRFVFIGMISLGGVIVLAEDGFVRVESFSARVQGMRWGWIYGLLIEFLLFVFWVFFAYGAYGFWLVGFKSSSPIMGLSFGVMHGFILFMALLCIVELGVKLFIRLVKQYKMSAGND